MTRQDIERQYRIASEKPVNAGIQYKLENGCSVIVYQNGNILVQGNKQDEVKKKLGLTKEVNKPNKNVFVVYGHDENAKIQLEAMLRRWSLEPIILDQQRSDGKTIIEKLEDCMEQASFGIVLATPDDQGHRAHKPEEIKYRVRQNVVLELGMLLSKLGRNKVAILHKTISDFETPTDIHGYLYIPFSNSIEETARGLAKEMSGHGYSISVDVL